MYKQTATYQDITLENVTVKQAQNTLRPKMELGEIFTVRREGRTPRKGRTATSRPVDYMKVQIVEYCPICTLVLEKKARFIKLDKTKTAPPSDGIIEREKATETCRNPICQDFRKEFEEVHGHPAVVAEKGYGFRCTPHHPSNYISRLENREVTHYISYWLEDYVEGFIERNRKTYTSTFFRDHKNDPVKEEYENGHLFEACIDWKQQRNIKPHRHYLHEEVTCRTRRYYEIRHQIRLHAELEEYRRSFKNAPKRTVEVWFPESGQIAPEVEER